MRQKPSARRFACRTALGPARDIAPPKARRGPLAVIAATLALAVGLPAAQAQDVAGRFDYYVMALSWSPNWCALEGDRRNAPECDGSRDLGWTLHGLWPQYERGWPSDCLSRYPDPSRRMTREMEDIMGASGLAWYQWNKHGACAGLPAGEYFELARTAYNSVTYPDVLERLRDPVRLPASLIEEAFLAENPQLEADMLTVTCRADMIQEVRICLTKDLEPRRCGADVIRDCSLDSALFTPVR